MSSSEATWPSPVLRRLFHELSERHVRWAVLRGRADLQHPVRDKDLLVAPDDLPVFEAVVEQLGGVPLPKWVQGAHGVYWFRRPGSLRPGLLVDVVTSVTFGKDGGMRTNLAQACLERRRLVNGVYELAPTDAFWTTLLHCLLDKGYVKPRRAQELSALVGQVDRPSEPEAVAAGVCPPGWSPDRLIRCVEQGRWDTIEELARQTVRPPEAADVGAASGTTEQGARFRSGSWRGALPHRDSMLGQVVKVVYAKGWRAARQGREVDVARRGGPVRVSLSGLDGSGKSRQTSALAADLRSKHSVELVWVPFDIWPGSMLKLVPMGVRVHLGPRGRTAATEHLTAEQVAARGVLRQGRPDAAEGALERVARAFWWAIATFAAVSAGVSLRRRLERVTADVVILDRYRIDTIVKLQSWYPAVSPTYLARIVLRLTPAPDVECLLRVSGAEAYGRKPEQYNVTQLTRQARLYDELVATLPGVVVVDVQDAPEAVAATVLARVRRALDGR